MSHHHCQPFESTFGEALGVENLTSPLISLIGICPVPRQFQAVSYPAFLPLFRSTWMSYMKASMHSKTSGAATTRSNTEHYVINKAIREHFRFPVGWDYFPISKKDFEDSKSNVSLKSGYEVLLREDTEREVKNLFQFNLQHRISIFSNQPTHPQTGKWLSP